MLSHINFFFSYQIRSGISSNPNLRLPISLSQEGAHPIHSGSKGVELSWALVPYFRVLIIRILLFQHSLSDTLGEDSNTSDRTLAEGSYCLGCYLGCPVFGNYRKRFPRAPRVDPEKTKRHKS